MGERARGAARRRAELGKQFEQNCLRKKWCVLVFVAGPRLNDGDKKATQLAREHRGVRLSPSTPPSTRCRSTCRAACRRPRWASSGQTLVLLKDLGATGAAGGEDDEGGGVARASAAVLLESGLGDAAATGKRLAEALAAADDFPTGLTRLTKRPSLKSRTPPPTPPRADVREEAPKAEPASRTYTDAELKAERERVAKEAREREEQRRAAMAEEEAQAGNVVEEVAEEDDIKGDGDDEEEEEDERWRRWSSTRIERQSFVLTPAQPLPAT